MDLTQDQLNKILIWSARYGLIKLVKLMLDHGANVHAGYDWALRRASTNGHTEVVKLLLDHGANVHAYDDEALRWASWNEYTEVVKLIKECMR